MIKAVVFDFDGLILDTESVWFECYQEVLRGYKMELALEQFAPSIGTHGTEFLDYIDLTLKQPGISVEIDKAVGLLHQQKMEHLEARAGVKEYLEEAQQLGLNIGLATSSNRAWIERFLTRLGLVDYFQVIRTSDDVTRVKPDPELYTQVVTAMGIAPAEALAFEDSLNGLTAAKAAGLHCTIVPNPVTSFLPFEHHDLRLVSMTDMTLSEILDRMNESTPKG